MEKIANGFDPNKTSLIELSHILEVLNCQRIDMEVCMTKGRFRICVLHYYLFT